jgi:TPR repeat protein
MRKIALARAVCATTLFIVLAADLRAQGTIGGVWTGGYNCAEQSPRRMTFTIRGSGTSLTGTISVEVSPNSAQRFTYQLAGSFDSSTGRFTMRPVVGQTAVPNNSITQIDGNFDARSEIISGSVSSGGCAFTASFKESASAATSAGPASPALAALDAISDKEWLDGSIAIRDSRGRALLARVIAASSKAALEEAAKSDPRAQMLVGTGYFFGASGYPKSNADAARWFALAASQGNPHAQYQLAELHMGYAGVEKEEAKARQLIKLAADQGHADALDSIAMAAVARRWAEGNFNNDEAKDPLLARALTAYQRDAAAGSAHAIQMIGEYYYAGLGVAADNRVAYANFKKAADLGDLDALRQIGTMTERGEGVAKDEAAAARIYRQCADKGDLKAQTFLARMIETGRGGFKANKAEAIRLYKLSAKQGEREAELDLKRLGESW